MAQHIFFQGPLGSGKTFLMTLFAHNIRERVRLNGGDVSLFSNYGMKDAKRIDHYTDWYEVAACQPSICSWDESHMAFNSRSWGRYGQTVATDVMMFTRKMKSIQLYASPSVMNVDSRVRQIIEVLVSCRNIGKKGFQYTFWDYQTGEFMHRKFMPMGRARRFFKLKLYDTYEFVRRFPVPTTETETNRFWDEIESIHRKAQTRPKVVV